MIDVKVIASGSKGNCTALTTGDTIILLDAGIKFKAIQEALNFKNPTAALITHEHKDHANIATLKELLKRGVDVYATIGTIEALNLPRRHNLRGIATNVIWTVGNCFANMIPAHHDAAAPASFFVNDGNDFLGYVVDTGCVDKGLVEQRGWITKLLIETNYTEATFFDAPIDAAQKERISQSHLAVEQVVEFFEAMLPDMASLKEIWLMHISNRHGNGELFRQMVEAVVPENVTVNIGASK